MSEVRDQAQRHIAAVWDAVHSLGADAAAERRLGDLIAEVAEAEAQLAGVRLHLLNEARLRAAESVVAEVRQSVRTTPAQATAALRLASDLGDRFPLIAAALNDGSVSLAQAEGIVAGLRKIPARLSRDQLVECQETILGYVDTLGPSELRMLASRLVEVVDPDLADADEARRLAAQERAAHRGRFLRLASDFHGSMRITGQLPVADAALLSAQLDALMPPQTTYTEAGEVAGPEARRADALVLLMQVAAGSGLLPALGGDRPRVHVTLDYATLTSGLGPVTVLGVEGVDGLSAGEARRLAFDADLVPIVLGTGSRPLDVGRTYRAFTPGIRAALVQRDQGCVFPGCTAPPAACEAHHIIPWRAGGPSRLANGVLLCPHHHRLAEPDPLQSGQSQWRVHRDEVTGLPWFTPPRHIDPYRGPRQHQRHRLQQAAPRGTAPPCPSGLPDPDPPDIDTEDTWLADRRRNLDACIQPTAAWAASPDP